MRKNIISLIFVSSTIFVNFTNLFAMETPEHDTLVLKQNLGELKKSLLSLKMKATALNQKLEQLQKQLTILPLPSDEEFDKHSGALIQALIDQNEPVIITEISNLGSSFCKFLKEKTIKDASPLNWIIKKLLSSYENYKISILQTIVDKIPKDKKQSLLETLKIPEYLAKKAKAAANEVEQEKIAAIEKLLTITK